MGHPVYQLRILGTSDHFFWTVSVVRHRRGIACRAEVKEFHKLSH